MQSQFCDYQGSHKSCYVGRISDRIGCSFELCNSVIWLEYYVTHQPNGNSNKMWVIQDGNAVNDDGITQPYHSNKTNTIFLNLEFLQFNNNKYLLFYLPYWRYFHNSVSIIQLINRSRSSRETLLGLSRSAPVYRCDNIHLLIIHIVSNVLDF